MFDINDFDETLPAPWEWDVKRLATSFVVAARANGLDEASARETAGASVRSYREQMHVYAEMSPLDVWYSRVTADDSIARATDAKTRGRRKRWRPRPGDGWEKVCCRKLPMSKRDSIGLSIRPPR